MIDKQGRSSKQLRRAALAEIARRERIARTTRTVASRRAACKEDALMQMPDDWMEIRLPAIRAQKKMIGAKPRRH